jgi:hypothetical protein
VSREGKKSDVERGAIGLNVTITGPRIRYHAEASGLGSTDTKVNVSSGSPRRSRFRSVLIALIKMIPYWPPGAG